MIIPAPLRAGAGAHQDEIAKKNRALSMPPPAGLDQAHRPRDGVATACRA